MSAGTLLPTLVYRVTDLDEVFHLQPRHRSQAPAHRWLALQHHSSWRLSVDGIATNWHTMPPTLFPRLSIRTGNPLHRPSIVSWPSRSFSSSSSESRPAVIASSRYPHRRRLGGHQPSPVGKIQARSMSSPADHTPLKKPPKTPAVPKPSSR